MTGSSVCALGSCLVDSTPQLLLPRLPAVVNSSYLPVSVEASAAAAALPPEVGETIVSLGTIYTFIIV